MGKLLRRLAVLLRWRRLELDLDEELQTHREMARLDSHPPGIYLSRSPAAVSSTTPYAALTRNRSRDVWLWPPLQDVMQDFRFAARLLGKDRRFTFVVLMVLGLGIGINNMLFTVLNAHTIRGLPIDRPDRVLFLSTVDETGRPGGLSYPEVTDLRAATNSFASIAAFVNTAATIGDDGRAPERQDGAYLTSNAFEVVGARPLAGRLFVPDDDRSGASPVVLLGDSLWRVRYNGALDVVGRSVLVNGAPATVVGVVSDRSGLPSTAQVWLPLAQMPGFAAERREVRPLRVLGRLRDGVAPPTARAEVEGIAERLQRDYPDTNARIRARAVPVNEQFLGRLSDPAWRAFIAVGFLVLAISSANVANLFLNRSVERAREVAVRTALGATRTRIVRQLLIEASVLAAASAVVGCGVAAAGVRLFRGLIPDNVLPYWFDYSMDWRVLAMLVGVSMSTVLVFGVVPAISGSKTNVNRALKDTREIGSRGHRRWTTVFLTAEFALAVVMLANLVLSVRLARSELPSDAVIDTPDVLTAAIMLTGARYDTADQRAGFLMRLEQRLNAMPVVTDASIANVPPLAGGATRQIQVAGRIETDGGSTPDVLTVTIGPHYFQTFRLSLVAGREFNEHDGATGEPHVIVNERAARLFFGDESPIGERIRLRAPGAAESSPDWLTVVGVAPNIRHQPRARVLGAADTDPVVYLPYRSAPPTTIALLVRGAGDPRALATTVRELLLELDPNVALFRVRTMAGVIDDAGWNSRVSQVLFNVLALIAVTTATVGLYAVTAHAVHQRTPELGLRTALGAGQWQIARLILGRVLGQLSLGFLAGIGCTVLWGRAFPSGDSEVIIESAGALAAIAAVLAALGLAATLVPLRRALRLDPAAALRHE